MAFLTKLIRFLFLILWLTGVPILLLGLLEAGYRLLHHEPLSHLIDYTWDNPSSACQLIEDPLLGWTNKPGIQNWLPNGTQMTFLNNGIRSNTFSSPQTWAPILTVGDELTLGIGLSDNQTWPAILEQILKAPVQNGSVCEYGLDQSILRVEQLIPALKPSIFLVTTTPSHLNRILLTQFKQRNKPIFILEDGQPRRVHAAPNVSQPDPTATPPPFSWERIAHYSLLATSLPNTFPLRSWLFNNSYLQADKQNPQLDQKDILLACQLLERLYQQEKMGSSKAFFMIQYSWKDILNRKILENFQSPRQPTGELKQAAQSLQLIQCAKKIGLGVIDTYYPFAALIKKKGEAIVEELFTQQITPEGNQLIAQYVASYMTPFLSKMAPPNAELLPQEPETELMPDSTNKKMRSSP
ncbi:MAG: hypothetical protein H7832_08365 [Magnetococcus sp. DMHC-6]